MELTSDAVEALLLAAIVVGLAAVALAGMALKAQKRVRHAYRTFSQGSREDVLTLLERHIDEVRGLRRDVERIDRRSDELRELIGTGLSRVGTVRYDAFEDMGGRLSFSMALLDEHGDGMVLTAINGRVDTRTYVKSVSGGQSKHNLSGEEAEAIERALSLAGRVAGAVERSDAPRPARSRRRPANAR